MKLLLTGAYQYDEEQIEYLRSLGNEIVFVQDERIPIPFDVADIEGVICNGLFLYTPIERFESLRYIQLTAAGLDRVPLDYIRDHGIRLYNARGVYSVPMAEFVLGGILQFYKQASFFYENRLAHRWEKHRGLEELAGKKALIVGCGSIGTEIAKRLRAFDCRVTGIDPFVRTNDAFDSLLPSDRLEEALTESDIVVLTLPLTEDNRRFFDKEKLALMKREALLVNVARGALVNERDLIDALRNNTIGGAVLDVFEEEPLSETSPLWELDNVILTPHNSFVGNHNRQRMFEVFVNHLKQELK